MQGGRDLNQESKNYDDEHDRLERYHILWLMGSVQHSHIGIREFVPPLLEPRIPSLHIPDLAA